MAKKLISASNTQKALRIIRRAFWLYLGAISRSVFPIEKDDYQFDFEHEQWFVIRQSTGACWSVHDTAQDVGFEKIIDGDDEV